MVSQEICRSCPFKLKIRSLSDDMEGHQQNTQLLLFLKKKRSLRELSQRHLLLKVNLNATIDIEHLHRHLLPPSLPPTYWREHIQKENEVEDEIASGGQRSAAQ